MTTRSVPRYVSPAALPVEEPLPVPRRIGGRRFRVLHAAFAVALVIGGALGAGALVAAASADGEYLAVVRDVDYGTRLSAADLATVRVGSPPGVELVAAAELDRVVGLYAAVPLVAGSLLTVAMLTADPVPAPGEHVVGVTLRGDRLPAQRPRPGDEVLLVTTGDDGGEAAVGERTWPATVTSISTPADGLFAPGGASGTVTLDVVVPVAQGPAIARAAAAGELVVVLTAGD